MEAVVVPLTDDFSIFEHKEHGAISAHLRADCQVAKCHCESSGPLLRNTRASALWNRFKPYGMALS